MSVYNKKRQKFSYTIGVDEVGRGPLAGPVCVCALALSKIDERKLKIESKRIKFADSKKLNKKQREEWAKWRRGNDIPYAVSFVSTTVIDKIRIHNAVNKAAQNAYNKLILKINTRNFNVIADGGIKINAINFRNFPKADETVPAVSLASIIAKLHRDARMIKLDKIYPNYGFVENKGYGTKYHINAIKKHGPSKIHRLTFIKKCSKFKQHNNN